MSDQNSPVVQVSGDADATADNLFASMSAPAEQAPSQPIVGGVLGEAKSVLSFDDLSDKRFTVRANNSDVELTALEAQAAIQKGLGYDKLANELGEARKLEEAAKSWQQFEQGILQNPGAMLAAYGQQHGLMVGRQNAQGMFEPVDAGSFTPPADSSGGPSSNPELAELKQELAQTQELMRQMVGHTASQQAEAQLMQQHNATAQEIEQAKAYATRRNLPLGALDLALQAVRAAAGPAQQEQAAVAAGSPVTGSDSVEQLLAAMKAQNPQLGGSPGNTGVPGTSPIVTSVPESELTYEQEIQKNWIAAKRELGITGGIQSV